MGLCCTTEELPDLGIDCLEAVPFGQVQHLESSQTAQLGLIPAQGLGLEVRSLWHCLPPSVPSRTSQETQPLHSRKCGADLDPKWCLVEELLFWCGGWQWHRRSLHATF